MRSGWRIGLERLNFFNVDFAVVTQTSDVDLGVRIVSDGDAHV